MSVSFGCLGFWGTPFSPVLEVVWADSLFDAGSNPQVREQIFFDRVETFVLTFMRSGSAVCFCFELVVCAFSWDSLFCCWASPECLVIIIILNIRQIQMEIVWCGEDTVWVDSVSGVQDELNGRNPIMRHVGRVGQIAQPWCSTLPNFVGRILGKSGGTKPQTLWNL